MQDHTDMQENSDYILSCASSSRVFSSLLQQAWLQFELTEANTSSMIQAPLCLNDLSRLLGFIMQSIKSGDEVVELKLRELLVVWAHMIADWNDWDKAEDLVIFDSIHEAINLHKDYDYTNFFMEKTLSQNSIIEGISAFVSSGILAYSSATKRACSCVHELLHMPKFSIDTLAIKQSVAVSFTIVAFSRFKDIKIEDSKSSGIFKPLLLAISSCYISFPEVIEQVLDKEEDKGFMSWVHALAEFSIRDSEPCLSMLSEIKLADKDYLHKCSVSLLETTIHLKKVKEKNDEASDEVGDEEDSGVEEDDDEESDYNEDSEDDVLEETEEELLDRYAKVAAEVESYLVEEEDSENEAETINLAGQKAAN